MFGNGFRAAENFGFDSEFEYVRGNGFGIEAVVVAELLCVVHAAENHFVGRGERLRQGFLEDFAAHRVRTGFENGPKASAGPAAAGGGDGRADGGGMMRKIVDDENAAEFTFNVEATLYACESFESFLNLGDRNAAALRDDDGGEGVQHVVFTGSGEMEFAKSIAVAEKFEVHAIFGCDGFASDPLVLFGEAVRVYWTKCFFRRSAQFGTGILSIAPDDDAAVARNEIYQALEG